MRCLVAVFICLFLAGSGAARTITVDNDGPADFDNVQAAIYAANGGDTVEIRPGTYTGLGNRDIDFLGKAITVTGTDPNDPNIVAATIIDCNATQFDSHWGFYIHDNNDSLCVIAGLTITESNVGGADGGGIRCDDSRVLIRNCVLANNECVLVCTVGGCWGGDGAAIYCADSNALITGCTITNNTGENAVGFSNSTAVVAGCTLSANDARAIYCERSIVQVEDCTLRENHAYDGAGLSTDKDSFVTIDRCTMEDNHASRFGGAVVVRGSTVTISNSIVKNNSSLTGTIWCWANGVLNLIDSELVGNYASNGCGALFCMGELTISGCKITGNQAALDVGGIGIYCPATITNSLISGNTANNGNGGGISFAGRPSSLTMTNCVVAYNEAKQYGGGLDCILEATAIITNCTFIQNVAGQFGGGISLSSEETNLTLTNSILWANADSSLAGQSRQIYDDSTVTPMVTYNCIEGGWLGDGNIDADPCFVDPGYWDPNETPEDANDDFWIGGDYHLKSQAGRWDANEGRWVIDGVMSPCIDAGDVMSPVGHEPFANGGIVNMGAYGGTGEASKSYFGKPPCETIVAGDINGDCEVNFEDFRLMALHWMEDLRE